MIFEVKPGGNKFGSDMAVRSRYQIPFGIIIAILLPVLFRVAFTGVEFSDPNQANTAVGGAIALVAGYIAYRRLHVFPGLASGGYIITSFSAMFATLVAVLIMLRIDYSRLQLLTSYVLTLGYYLYIHLRFGAQRPLILGVISSADEEFDLPEIGRVIWYQITDPGASVPPIQGILVDLNANLGSDWNSRITSFVLEGTPVFHIKEALEQLRGWVEIKHLSENTLGSLNPNDNYLKIKAMMDFTAAIILITITLPLMLLVAALVRLDSPGPALFLQQRTGFRAKPFTIYKFRTMRVEPLQELHDRKAAMTREDDPRITRLGAFLRKSRIDELPQLFNVIRGQMSLIGPRPEAVALTQWYEKEIAFYHYRHIIKPGITGWAQINLGHVAEVDDVRKKLNYDFYYVKNFSAWLDILIVLRTFRTLVTGKGAK